MIVHNILKFLIPVKLVLASTTIGYAQNSAPFALKDTSAHA